MDLVTFLSYRNSDDQNAPVTPKPERTFGGRAVGIQRLRPKQHFLGSFTSWPAAGTRTASQTCWMTGSWWWRWWMGTPEVCSFAEPGASTHKAMHASARNVPRVFTSLINVATDCSGTQALWAEVFQGDSNLFYSSKTFWIHTFNFPSSSG